jgi:hypothetical protein
MAAYSVLHSVKVVRWIARLWSILIIIATLIIFLSPDSYGNGPIPAVDKFLLSLILFALLGLLAAWRWELVGSIFTITVLFIRELAWVILKGNWLIGFLLLWLLIAPPAVMFLIAWNRERRIEGR